MEKRGDAVRSPFLFCVPLVEQFVPAELISVAVIERQQGGR